MTERRGAQTGAEVRADVAVVGAGPAGLAAAARAAEAGRRVVVLDEGLAPGGQIWRHRRGTRAPRSAARWIDRGRRAGVEIIDRASVVAASGDGTSIELTAERAGGTLAVSAARLVLATGARELFLPFPGWTLPGVVGIGGAQALLKSGMSFAGKRVVIAGSGPLLLPVAASLARAGADLRVVAEQAPTAAVRRFALGLWRQPGKLWQAARYRAAFAGCRYRLGVWPLAAAGDGRVEEVTLTDGNERWRKPCDVLATAFGLVPNTELARLLGCELADDDSRVRVDAMQRTLVGSEVSERVYCAGEPCGIGGLELALVEGEIAGLAAAGSSVDGVLHRRRDALRRFAADLAVAFRPRAELRELADDDTIVCRCEDVRRRRLDPAWTPRQAKLYTRVGMGPCQGRVCGPALGVLFGWPADSVRLPIQPVPAGRLVRSEAVGSGRTT